MHSRITDQEKRRRVWRKAGGRCAHCGGVTSGRNRTIDHFVPRSFGGGLDYRNLMPLCRSCNEQRGNFAVNPETYYPYASKDAVRQCLEYHMQWMLNRTSTGGMTWI